MELLKAFQDANERDEERKKKISYEICQPHENENALTCYNTPPPPSQNTSNIMYSNNSNNNKYV